MATYEATLMHAERGGEGTYQFEAAEGLINKSAFSTVRAFMEHLARKYDEGEFDWHVHAAFRNKDKGVVTAMGEFVFGESDEQPFVAYIRQL